MNYFERLCLAAVVAVPLWAICGALNRVSDSVQDFRRQVHPSSGLYGDAALQEYNQMMLGQKQKERICPNAPGFACYTPIPVNDWPPK